MKRKETIKSQNEFNNIIKNGFFHKNKYLVLYYNERTDNNIMYGIAISKKVGKAHLRNYIKRITRTALDKNRNLFKNGYNYIIMIRKSCSDIKYAELEKALIDIAERERK